MSMPHEKKLEFIHKMAKMGLQSFDSGGVATAVAPLPLKPVIGGIVNSIPAASEGTPGQQNPYVQSNATNPNTGLLGTIGGALGLNDNFQASSANVTPGTNAAQLQAGYTGAQNALAGQQAIAGTLAPQVGQAAGNQNALANQLYGMTLGQGPNPAQAQLAQNTAANVAQQNALMAGQRGSAQNVGLIARQAGQTGAAQQQASVGQQATLQAQQQIAAQQNLANLANTQINQAGQAATGLSSAQQGEQGILQNANTGFNNAIVGMQSNINNVNSQTAAANQNMSGNILGGIGSAISSGGGLSSLFAEGGEVDQEPTNLGTFTPSSDSAQGPNIPGTSTLPADSTNLSQSFGSSGKSGGGGGGMGGIASLAALLAKGGEVDMGSFNPYAGGSMGGPSIPATGALPADTNNFAKDVQSYFANKKPQTPGSPQGSAVDQGGLMSDNSSSYSSSSMPGQMNAAHGGSIHKEHFANHIKNYFSGGKTTSKVPAMVSPGEIYLSPDKVHKVLNEGANPLKIGQRIPGKAKIKGDSYQNDTVRANLDEGGVVVDRKNAMDPHKAALFVHQSVRRGRK